MAKKIEVTNFENLVNEIVNELKLRVDLLKVLIEDRKDVRIRVLVVVTTGKVVDNVFEIVNLSIDDDPNFDIYFEKSIFWKEFFNLII